MLEFASPELLTLIIFSVALLLILMGHPIAFALMGAAAFVGITAVGPKCFDMFQSGLYTQATSYSMLAVPLFVFMGHMIETTGITRRMFEAVYVWIGKMRGSLLVVTIIIGTILAACVGVIAASVTMLGLIGLPMMMERGYDKKLACGAICSSGSLGILIPPSVLLVMYGPTAGLSVGKLFMGAMGPGLLLAAMYIAYNLIMCHLHPSYAPTATREELDVSTKEKVKMLIFSLLPPVLLIVAVLGSIMFGIAAPTEAAAVGALASILLSMAYRTFNMKNLTSALQSTAKNYAMVQMIIWAAKAFTTLFLKMGCGNIITNIIGNMPGGRWSAFLIIMLITFVLGMFIDWIGIIMIMVPIITPLVTKLGFDEIWFAMMIITNLQLSFITPPFAYSIFFLKDVTRPEWGISTGDIIRGIVPYIFIIAFTLVLCCIFPQILTWLPSIAVG
ncbi:TRAP transporter large permease subunit [Clostridium sp. AM58-1XD]|uniref:TRAP transporter large permease n=1 Tax=Clostridium sp. AM58-1XD TaxID=2292307 RepID=UPI000E517305|nr:TRAP transporter large permease subunit [Clostridium sp. AM58-1XD]RGY97176.1 C4-dicarboxylate ABC transporter [Clostridium sp. AM58-1XD]